jgi:hypothetical protein
MASLARDPLHSSLSTNHLVSPPEFFQPPSQGYSSNFNEVHDFTSQMVIPGKSIPVYVCYSYAYVTLPHEDFITLIERKAGSVIGSGRAEEVVKIITDIQARTMTKIHLSSRGEFPTGTNENERIAFISGPSPENVDNAIYMINQRLLINHKPG